jgi:hypothetical protein
MKQEKEINHRYYVEYIDGWNGSTQTYVYLVGKNREQIEAIMDDYVLIAVDQTD